jgi:serine/threonine protein kinase
VRGAAALEQPVPFGERYSLVRRLATGGMAEIYLARQAAMAGFDKEVVIKRLKPNLAGDTRIVEMFLDEARIGALLNHPNIVHVYDVDEHEGVPYIAMEYIVGEELNELCRRGLTAGKFLPIEHAIELIRQAASGMGYFHARQGDGDPLGIIHCDISPSNLLVTEDGFLKVIDFGIARARGQKFRTEGIIPGKLSYMAPEQAARQELDHRSDIFSLGVVLYEITVGRRLFKGPAHEVVRRLVDGEIEAPTFAKREFPPALEAIVLRALERHPEARYQSAYDLADDLEAFLRDSGLHSGPVRIARYLDDLALAQGGKRRPELISEAEQRAREQDLDFDSEVFDGIRHAQLAPEWEDDDEPDAQVAEALGMGLDELRAMRTPVPREGAWLGKRPPSDLPLPAPGPGESFSGEESAESATNPVPRVDAAEVDDGEPAIVHQPFDSVLASGEHSAQGARGTTSDTPPFDSVRASGERSARGERGASPRLLAPAPTVGAGMLANAPSPGGAPWLVVIGLLVAVVALVVYILV